jgi:hypothetical protein
MALRSSENAREHSPSWRCWLSLPTVPQSNQSQMRQQGSRQMNARARNFIAANELSPVVYGSVAENGVVYRLANGKMFNLSLIEARQAPNPRWAFVA